MKPALYIYYKKGYGTELFTSFSDPCKDDDAIEITELWDIDFTKYKVVPLEPTDEMVKYGKKHFESLDEDTPISCFISEMGEIMIDAAPDIEDL